MAAQSSTELARQKRQLRAEIARSRRAIERHATALAQQTRATLSWRHWVRTFPLPAVASAFSLGLLLSAGLGSRVARSLTRGVLGLAMATFWRQTLSLAASTAFNAWAQQRQSQSGGALQAGDLSSRSDGSSQSEPTANRSHSPKAARPEASRDRAEHASTPFSAADHPQEPGAP